MHYIYVIQKIDDLRVYVGQTINITKRWSEHKRLANKISNKTLLPCEGQYITRAMAKYGLENFEFQIWEQWETQKDADDAEDFWMDFFQSRIGGKGFNVNKGGNIVSGPNHPNYGQIPYNKLFDNEQETDICKKYVVEKFSVINIGKMYDCDPVTICNILKKHNIKMYGAKVFNKGKRYSPNTEFKVGQKSINRKFSEDKEKEICNKYVVDKISAQELAKMYGCCRTTITRILYTNNIDMSILTGRVSKIKFTDEEIKYIIQDHFEGMSILKLSKKYKANKDTILRIVNKFKNQERQEK